ncbi:hypothetical protein Tco_0627709 [Tanacetum coccineum]|uniref:Transposase (Putative), gypsy type n=1 Tax=Tanacetum coccineum TaxID=301880 RepID=A0ABQ4WN62_9ASTR
MQRSLLCLVESRVSFRWEVFRDCGWAAAIAVTLLIGRTIFFWIDVAVFPLSIPWFDGVSIVKYPLPVEDIVDLLCVELLNVNRTVIRKYSETFLCLVGLSRSFINNDVHPKLLYDDDEEMGLLDFVKSADPFKVKTGERTLAKDEVPLLTENEGRVISPFADIISLVDHTIQDELKANRVKKKKRVAFVVGSPPIKRVRTKDIIAFDTQPTTADDSDHGENVRTCPPSGRFTVLSSSSADTDIPASPQVVPSTTVVVESEDEVHDTSAPETEVGGLLFRRNVTNGARIDNLTISRNFLDHVTPPSYWDALRNQSNAGFLNSFNVNSAQHTSMVSKLHLRFEHEIMSRENFEKKFTESAAIIQQRDAEIVDLKVKLEKAEREAAEVTTLRQHMSKLEAAATARASEVVALNEQNVELSGKVSALKLVRGELDVKISELTADCNSLRRLDSRIADMKCDMDDHLCPHMFTAITGRRWVVGHGLRLAVYKCAWSVECHIAMGKMISMPLKGLSACTYHVVSCSEDDHGDVDLTPSFNEFLPSLDQVSIPIYSESGEVIREMLLSEVIPSVRRSAKRRGLCPPSSSAPTTSLGVSNYQISTLAQPHDNLFDTGVFDKLVDA